MYLTLKYLSTTAFSCHLQKLGHIVQGLRVVLNLMMDHGVLAQM